jgi:hypothetical protein
MFLFPAAVTIQTCQRAQYSNGSRITLRNTVYDGCSSHSLGGAVSIDRESSIFELSDCRFLHCHSDQVGGALEFFGDYFSMTRFTGVACTAQTRSFCCCWAFAATRSTSSMNESSGYLGSAFQDSFGFNTRQSPSSFTGILFNLNSTFNHVDDSASGFTSVGASPYSVTYARIHSNDKGGTIVVQVIPKDPYPIRCVEFWNNTIDLKTTNPGVIWSNIMIDCQDCVFLSNTAPYLVGTTQGAGSKVMNFLRCVFDQTVVSGIENIKILTAECGSRAEIGALWKQPECALRGEKAL